jgi:hypothetical protein
LEANADALVDALVDGEEILYPQIFFLHLHLQLQHHLKYKILLRQELLSGNGHGRLEERHVAENLVVEDNE